MNLYLVFLSIFSPNIAYADFDSILANINGGIVNPLIKTLITVALAFFIYGIVEFMANAESEDKRTKGKSHMLWGVIGLTIMLGVWGILSIVINTFNLEGEGVIDPENGKVQLQDYP